MPEEAVPEWAAWLREELREIRQKVDQIPGINARLDTLNGSVARNVQNIAANRASIETLAKWVDGEELRDKLAIARHDARYGPLRKVGAWLSKDGIVLKIGMAFLIFINLAIGVDLTGLWP